MAYSKRLGWSGALSLVAVELFRTFAATAVFENPGFSPNPNTSEILKYWDMKNDRFRGRLLFLSTSGAVWLSRENEFFPMLWLRFGGCARG